MIEKEQQAPLSVDDQIKNLIDLGLIIEDEEYAKTLLNDVSYFRLIKAYSLGLKPKNGDSGSDVTFESIVQLYRFNSNFRQQLFPRMDFVEQFDNLIKKYPAVKIDTMGFPENWKDLLMG